VSALTDTNIERAIKVVRAGLMTFIKTAELHKLVELAGFIERMENPDRAEVRLEVLRAFQREAAKRR
jgi:hypothetical protein